MRTHSIKRDTTQIGAAPYGEREYTLTFNNHSDTLWLSRSEAQGIMDVLTTALEMGEEVEMEI